MIMKDEGRWVSAEVSGHNIPLVIKKSHLENSEIIEKYSIWEYGLSSTPDCSKENIYYNIVEKTFKIWYADDEVSFLLLCCTVQHAQ